MTAYVPILKAKAGEVEALQHLADPPVEVRPLLELVPPSERNGTSRQDGLKEDGDNSNGDADDSTSSAVKFTKQLRKLASVLRDKVPQGVVCAIDTAYVDGSLFAQDVWEPLLAVLAEQLIQTPVRPVARLTDSPDRLTRAKEIAAEFNTGAVLRLGSPDRDTEPHEAAATLPRALAALGQDPSRIDLVIDLWAINDDRDVQRVCRSAQRLLEWADQEQWRSVTVASGAFPAKLTDLPTDSVSTLPRRDAELWRQVAQQRSGRVPDFGDYAVAHPALGKGFRGPTPNLRYTTDTHWQVWRQKSPPEEGNDRFCRICRKVVASEHFPATGEPLCWGDQQIALRARDCSAPGNAAKWRAFGTSRHLAVVTERLARFDEP